MARRGWSESVREVGRRWADPEHPPRKEAAGKVLAAENRFTAEGVAFALNHAADALARGSLDDWLGAEVSPFDGVVGVISRGRTPTEGLFEALASLLVARSVVFTSPAAAPAITEAFFSEMAELAGEERGRQVREAAIADSADALVARGTEADRRIWHQQCEAAGLPPERRLVLPLRTGVAVIDGTESHRELSGLAEDALLHEGGTPQSIRVVFAPEGLSPDGLLGVLAGFREVFPPHPETDGSMALRVAYMEALEISLAVGPGFLVSRGAFEPQDGAHIRWVEYGSLDEVIETLAPVDSGEIFVSASPAVGTSLLAAGLPTDVPVLRFGDAHRPEVGQPPLTPEVPAFLARLAASGGGFR